MTSREEVVRRIACALDIDADLLLDDSDGYLAARAEADRRIEEFKGKLLAQAEEFSASFSEEFLREHQSQFDSSDVIRPLAAE